MAGQSLEKVLCSGVGEDMDQALALLARKSSVNRGQPGADSSKVVKSPSRERADKASVVVDEVNDGGSDLVARSCKRNREGEEDNTRRPVARRVLDPVRFGPGKSLTITGVHKDSLPPVLQSSSSSSPLRIEVQTNERWTAGSNNPVQVFKAFNLPQDFSAYIDKSRDEIADRCLARGGRVTYLSVLCIFLI